MNLRYVILILAVAAVRPTLSQAQILDQMKKPIDYKKNANIGDKTVSFNDLQYGTVSQSSRSFATSSSTTKGDLQFQNANLNQLQLKSVDMSTVSEPVLPQVNFTAKRAVADTQNDKATVKADETTQKAPITNRQIRPMTPAGEQELKNQLNAIHP
ncbi:MAG TPA: hypothetical protein VMP11_19710 [Verrucomicrobiae bacterium]|nr:hypothetical protein [Verrucomicrobiae bacterium]